MTQTASFDLNGYTPLRPLKRGAAAATWLARRDDGDGGRVVVKFFTGWTAEWQERIAAAHGMLTMQNHAGVPRVYEIRRRDAALAVVLEYLPGRTLARRGGLDDGELLRAARQVAATLHRVWRDGRWLYRDVKPENIRLGRDGRVSLPDWHLAAPPGLEPGYLIGTPAYLSPEAFAGAELDDRSDQYSLGITLYEWWTGQRPFRQRALERLAEAHMTTPLPVAVLPPPVAALIGRMTAKYPDERFDDWVDVLDAIDEAEAEVK